MITSHLPLGAGVHAKFMEVARLRRHARGDRWFVDETYVKVAKRWTHLHRVVGQHG